ncbi:Hypothetical predicted protein [Mytilus galloprovincialis]|uniref:Innexin n=1 Tax=Mytilus galloprovincialis TaxID=29158 RepID=A0A8B6G628_MYTGA|nr:Hypothetical predicted protein [Mytilus galloprovincialis]
MVLVKILDKVLGPIGVYEGHRTVFDDNFVDRLCHYYTIIGLFFGTILVGTAEYVGNPIECWCPAELSPDEVKYVNFVCWVQNTYYIPPFKPVPYEYEFRYSNTIFYYQWVPLILLIMAVICKFPRLVWKYMSNRCGVGIKKLVELAKQTHLNSKEDREQKLKFVAQYIDKWCLNVRAHRSGIFAPTREQAASLCDIGCGRHHGNYLISIRIMVRIMYFAVSFGLLFFLNEFLQNDIYIYGYDVINKFLAGQDWSLNHVRFPRVTLCDFDLRQLSNIQRYTMQCVLPVNLYNEKLFIILWFWMTLISVMSFLNVLYTLIVAPMKKPRKNFIKKYLRLNEIYEKRERDALTKKLLQKFVELHLKHDGIFLLQLMSNNVGSAVMGDIIKHLWDLYRDRQFQINNGTVPKPADKNSYVSYRSSNGTLSKEYKKTLANESFV